MYHVLLESNKKYYDTNIVIDWYHFKRLFNNIETDTGFCHWIQRIQPTFLFFSVNPSKLIKHDYEFIGKLVCMMMILSFTFD